MFYYLVPGLMSYRVILIAAAVIPALFLMGKVYLMTTLSKELSYWTLIIRPIMKEIN